MNAIVTVLLERISCRIWWMSK